MRKILSSRNLNKSNSDSPQLSVERLDQIGIKNKRRPSPFGKKGCPKGDSARAKRVPIWFVFTVLFAGITLFPLTATADGGVFPPPYYRVYESGQKAVIFYEKGRETLILSTTFKGDAKDFGWVIPVPQKPEVTKGSDEIFTSLAEITRKYQKGIYPLAPMMGGGIGDGREAVTVIETKKIDYYDIAILSATDSEALVKWFSDNGYQYPEESAYILNDYISNKWYFVAVKISPGAGEAEEVESGLKEGHATPLKMEFNSEAIIYPLRISSIQGKEDTVKLSDNLVLNGKRIKYLKSIGYDELTDKEKGPEIFNQIVSGLLSKTDYYNSKASEYSLIISEDNYLAAQCYDIRSCRATVENWFNNAFYRQGLDYYYYYDQSYVPIYLYVIADGKKEIPGFSIDYANWIGAKDIRKLAYDVNGRPLISPQGKKYYLTSLYRTMSFQEMTQDLIIREAENNKRVNASNPWLNYLYGSLVALGCIFLWLFSPLGLIFIAATLIKALVKTRSVTIVSRVFQVLSFVITLGLFVLFLVLSFEPTLRAFVPFWTIGIACGLGLILAGQIIIGKKI